MPGPRAPSGDSESWLAFRKLCLCVHGVVLGPAREMEKGISGREWSQPPPPWGTCWVEPVPEPLC